MLYFFSMVFVLEEPSEGPIMVREEEKEKDEQKIGRRKEGVRTLGEGAGHRNRW